MEIRPEQIGEKIRQAREAKGLSQTEFANLLGYTQRDISQYEAGKRLVKITEFPKFAETLEVPFLYFFEMAIPDDDSFRGAMLEQLNRLDNDEDKNSLLVVVRAVCDALLRK